MIKYPIWFTCSLKCFQHLNIMGPFWAFLMEKWCLNVIWNFPTILYAFATIITPSHQSCDHWNSLAMAIQDYLPIQTLLSHKHHHNTPGMVM